MCFAQNKISDSRRRIREALAETISIQHIILISLQQQRYRYKYLRLRYPKVYRVQKFNNDYHYIYFNTGR